MTTLIEAAAKKLMTAIALDRHDVGDWPNDSRDAHETLEQAIAQEQPVRSCETCSHNKVSSYLYEPCCQCMRKRGHKDNWEPKP